MTFPCPDAVRCPDSSNPLTNFSSEDPDPPIRIGYSTGTAPTTSFIHHGGAGPVYGQPQGPGPSDPPGPLVTPGADTGTGGDPPPLGTEWDNAIVTTFIEVTDPSQNPDDVAGNANVEQLVSSSGIPGEGGWRQPNGQQQPVFVNHPQTCTIFCSDGSPFSYTVPVGTFRAFTQAKADAAAHSFACKQAHLNRLCLGSISSISCIGTAYNQTIVADSANIPITFTVIAGSIPSWLNVTVTPNAIRLQGTPGATDAGISVFTVQAIDSLGFTVSKDYSIVCQQCGAPCLVTTAILPAFDQGQPYSQQIDVTGGTAPYTFSIVSGVLPAGLTLSSSGLVSGTAALTNGNLDQTFIVAVSDSGSPSQFCTGTILLPVLNYHNFPPGKHWRIQGYFDGIMAGCCSAAVGNVWDGTFDQSIGGGQVNFRPSLGLGLVTILNGGPYGACRPFLRVDSALYGDSEWRIVILCAVDVGAMVWIGKKVGSNAGVKLDSPAGVYTLTTDGFHTVCNGTPTFTIEEY